MFGARKKQSEYRCLDRTILMIPHMGSIKIAGMLQIAMSATFQPEHVESNIARQFVQIHMETNSDCRKELELL